MRLDRLGGWRRGLAVAGVCAGAALAPHAAQAYWFHGRWIPGVIVAPPVVVGAPVVVAAPPPPYYPYYHRHRFWIGPHWQGPYWVPGRWGWR